MKEQGSSGSYTVKRLWKQAAKNIIVVKCKEKGGKIAMRVSEHRNRNPEKMSDMI